MAVNRSSPKRKATLQAEVARVYQGAILEAAKRVFGEHGFEKAKMVDIAKSAGLAAGTLYNYFESKERIFQSLIETQLGEAAARFEVIAQKDLPPKESLAALVKEVFAFMEDNRDMVEIFVSMGVGNTWSMTRLCGAEVMEHRDRMRALFEKTVARAAKAGLLRKDIPAGDLIAMLSGSMNGFIEEWMTAGAKGRLVDHAEVVIDLFFNGAAKR